MLSCIILAGGESRRMGRDKRFLKVDGEYLLSRVFARVRDFADEIIVSLGEGEDAENVAGNLDAVFVNDEKPGFGPIMGMLTCLRKCKGEYCAVVPCDSPFIEPETFRFMLSVAEGRDAVVPFTGLDRSGVKKIEPLHSIYRVSSMVKACEKVVADGKRGVRDAIAELEQVRYVSPKELRRYDRKLLGFLNVNNPEDFKRIQEGSG